MEIVHDNETMMLGKVWLYVLDKEGSILYQDYAISKIDKYETDLVNLFKILKGNSKLEEIQRINSQEYRFNIKDNDKYIAIYIGLCMMKEKEYSSIIKNNCFGKLEERLATS